MRLKREDVLAAALRLLDQVGLDALTMRRLADALGVQAGALYWHFADKQALHDAMAEAILAGLIEPPLTGAWDEKLAGFARRLRVALSCHRDAGRLVSELLRPSLEVLKMAELTLGTMAEGGLTGRIGLWAAGVLSSYVVGFNIDVEGMKKVEAGGLAAVIGELEKVVDPGRFPHLHAMGRDLPALIGIRNVEERFEFGLEIVLSGIRAAARAQAAGARRATPRPGKARRRRS